MDITLTFIQLIYLALQITAPILMLLIGLIIVLGLIAGRADKLPPLSALYWALITATTVGYGDIRPTSRIARILSVIIALLGLILFGMIIAISVRATTLTVQMHADLSEFRAIIE